MLSSTCTDMKKRQCSEGTKLNKLQTLKQGIYINYI